MSLTNIKLKNRADSGFTIVELLIVVVVIAILAAITIVSYNGITARANQSAGKASASTFQKKAELFAGQNNHYPIGTGNADTPNFPGSDSTVSWYYTGLTATYGPSGTSALTSSSGNSAVRVLKCAASGSTQSSITATNITGLRVFYWDPLKSGGAGENSIDVGATTACPDAA